MTGWRLGLVVAPAQLADKINLIHRTFNGALNTFVQDAALTGLQTTDAQLQAAAESYQERLDLFVQRLSSVPGIDMLTPQGAFYAFPRITSGLSSDEMTDRFAEAGVLVRSGNEFGPSGEGHIRISFATDIASLEEARRRFIATVEHLPPCIPGPLPDRPPFGRSHRKKSGTSFALPVIPGPGHHPTGQTGPGPAFRLAGLP